MDDRSQMCNVHEVRHNKAQKTPDSPYLERRTSRQCFNLRVISDLLRVKFIKAGQCVFLEDFRLSAFADRGMVLC